MTAGRSFVRSRLVIEKMALLVCLSLLKLCVFSSCSEGGKSLPRALVCVCGVVCDACLWVGCVVRGIYGGGVCAFQ